MSTVSIAPQRLGVAEVFSDSRVLAGRQLRKTLRRPKYVSFSFVQPVIFVLLFRYVLGGAIHTGHGSYVNFLIPGIIVQTSIFGSLITGLGLTEDLATGVVDRFAFVGLAVKNPETAQSAGFIWVLPLTFASSAFVPTGSMPAAVHAFADANPVTFTVNAARALTVGGADALGPVLGTVAWMVGLLLVFVPLSVRAFRRA